jgi:subtilase family serine protease
MRFRTHRTQGGPRPGGRLRRPIILLASVITLAAAGSASAASAATSASAAPVATHTASVKHACATPTRVRVMQCMALINTSVAQRSESSIRPDQTPAGYGPSDLQSAYNLASASASDGSGETVYIVDAYDYPTAQADLNTYRSEYGLPACDAGCFTKVSQTGSTTSLPAAAGSTGWDVEEALDIDMVSAICPLCNITLVEANSDNGSDLYAAENEAVSLGAQFISNSWGTSEYSGEQSDADTYFNHPGVAITVSAGDSPGPEFPAEAQDVTAVGGTTLSPASNSRGWTESDWSDSGGGCSSYEPAPSWQSSSVTGCGNREDNDVSAVADPNTPVAIYNTYSQGGWLEVGGTSVASPLVASVYALAGPPGASTYPAQDIWNSEPNGLNSVVSGYDSVSGWGTPNGTSAFTG